MKLPEIGDDVTTEEALDLCRHFGLDYLVKRIESAPERYRSWKFDGCSGLPDRRLGFLTDRDWREITYECCLPHDLGYGYGESGNREERRRVDEKFYRDLVSKAGMKKWCAFLFFAVVRVGGGEALRLPFSWGFAGKRG
jgi:hypothetical protein